MKIYSKLLLALLCVFHSNIRGITAFVIQTPTKALTLKGRPSAAISSLAAFSGTRSGEQPSPSYSHLSGVKVSVKNPAFVAPNVGNLSEKNKAASVGIQPVKDIWESTSPVTVQGGSLRTWSFTTPVIERVQVLLKSEGRPVNANVELWQGPDNSPQKMKVYIEDGSVRPFCAVIETPRGNNAIAIRNTGCVEFPLIAGVMAEVGNGSTTGLGAATKALSEKSIKKTIQGGAVHTHPFGSNVASVQILLKTDGCPLSARIELLQGPNNKKQVVEVYTENGMERPLYAVIDTPGRGNVVRIVNTATVEFPIAASVEPYLIKPGSPEEGGYVDSYFILD
jgi:hypothetical protein